MFNSLGNLLNLTSFGESHGAAYGGIINNFPAGVEIDTEKIQLELDRRKPGQSSIVTQRKESDTVKFLSGIFEGKSHALRHGHRVGRYLVQRAADFQRPD